MNLSINGIIIDFISLISLASLFIALLMFIIAYITLLATIKFRSELSFPEQISNIPDILNEEYLKRQFSPPAKTNERELYNLKDARLLIQDELKLKGDETLEQARDRFLTSTLQDFRDHDYYWQNKFAYEVSLGLEQVGIMILTGAIPLNLVLVLCAYQIIEDWGYCSILVKEKIRGNDAPIPKSQDYKESVVFHRRHGEWLAYAAAIYMYKNYSGERLNYLISLIGEIEKIKKHEKKLRKFDSAIIPHSVNKNIEDILYN